MNAIIKSLTECSGKIIDKCLSSAVFGIFHSVFGGISWNTGQERCACTVVCNEHSAHFSALEIFLQLAYVVKEANGRYLLKNMRLIYSFGRFGRLISFGDFMISHMSALVKKALFCAIVSAG